VSSLPALESLPGDVRCARDYEAHARARLPPQAWAWLDHTEGTGLTRHANRAAWDELALWPRVLHGASKAHTDTLLLGRHWPSPVLVAPMALQKLVHPDGELGMALAAAMQGAGMVLAMQSSVALEAVAAAVREEPHRGPLWFQLYLLQDRGAMLELVQRAEAAGYEALVLTVDAVARASRPLPSLAGVHAVHLPEGAAFGSPSWDDVAWLRSHTRLPVLLKGVVHPEDAGEAQRQGVAGLIVSNHGGRVLDGSTSTAAALLRIADRVGPELPVLVDGGIQGGMDVLKALALGAGAVLVGRTALHGLAAAGAAGAAHVLRLLTDELRLGLLQCGVASPAAARSASLLS
jgi:4-hydroxymandelate oxidase